MSFDVYLEVDEPQSNPSEGKIFIREGGSIREISREEWDRRYPGREPVIVRTEEDSPVVYTANITSNLAPMARAAGIYYVLWHPADVDITLAEQLIAPLEAGLAKLKENPSEMQEYDPENKWGTYGTLVIFVENYLNACRAYPKARVSVWI